MGPVAPRSIGAAPLIKQELARAFVFPGQGSQSIGMGRDLAAASPIAHAVFEEVDEALGQKLSTLMFEGDPAELTLTENAQPALMAVSLAVMREVEARSGLTIVELVDCVAGHSLGEYSALAAAGAFSIWDCARLLKVRGRAMQAAVPVGVGAMAALMGVSVEEANAIARDAAAGLVCAAANDNAPGQVVVSGHREAVEAAVALAAERGARRSVLLPVSAPFHCDLMAPAAEAMREALDAVELRAPAVPLVANVTAQAVIDPDVIRDLLVAQVTGAVRWRESVGYMRSEGITEVVELGAGRVLSGLARRIDRDMTGLSLGSIEDIEAFVARVMAGA